jgi:1,4-dihydroxy-2-naphthoate polyprenyltransferase
MTNTPMKKPGILQIIRAPFFNSIITPLIAGTLLSVHINGHFHALQFGLVMIIGIGLHLSTTLYNDIYDTIQGTDKVNRHRNETSGGSGVLVNFPELMQPMFKAARISLVVVLAATVALSTLTDKELLIHLWLLTGVSVFFSKYYTAPPVKLAYRGLGEVSVWLAYGPMAILIAAVSQNTGFHPMILMLMPVTGLSTTSILLAAQLIDLEADSRTGKHGIAHRFGTKTTAWVYLMVQLTIVGLVLLYFYRFPGNTWYFLLCLIPYVFLLPRAGSIILKHHDNADKIKTGAKLTVLLHVAFSLLLIIALILYL